MFRLLYIWFIHTYIGFGSTYYFMFKEVESVLVSGTFWTFDTGQRRLTRPELCSSHPSLFQLCVSDSF